ncbi:MAG: type pilus assembly protein PilB, partial [Actinomycetota bacterium]|nr:type pilus assembly protein PilB [Actinomycetota bacterium]
MTVPATRRLGAILVDAKVLTEPSLADALDHQRGSGKRLGVVLVEMGLADDKTIIAALGIQSDLPVTDLRHRKPDHQAVALLPERLVRSLSVAPLRRTPRGLEIALAEPPDEATVALLESVVGEPVVQFLARSDDLLSMIDRCYPARGRHHPSPAAALQAPEQPAVPEPDKAPDPPVDHDQDLLHTIVADALQAGASDIHIDPQPTGTRVRYRIDGMLRDAAPLTGSSGATVIRCAKRLAGAASGGRRDRRWFELTVDGRTSRILVTTSKTIQGERLRLRLGSPDGDGARRLDELGMPADIRRSFSEELQRTSGVIVIAGPRGSGRTTTACAAASEMGAGGRDILTIQRTVSRVLPSVSQVEIGTESVVPALFAAVEDEDADGVVIDDLEGLGVTRAAFRMAKRGKLVVLIITAVDAAAMAAHLLETGLPHSLITDTLRSVLTQRLAPPAGSDPSDGRV